VSSINKIIDANGVSMKYDLDITNAKQYHRSLNMKDFLAEKAKWKD
jgi:hypothetical protein